MKMPRAESEPGWSVELDRAVTVISQARDLLLVCHLSPDGDALGSMLATHQLAQARGLTSVASWPEPFLVAPHYEFLPGIASATKPGDIPSDPDVVVSFDCGSLERLAELAPAALSAKGRGKLIVLDHHRTNDGYGSINVIDHEAAATAVVVRRLAHRLGWSLTRSSAICLYTGLVTDTGRFQYSNTKPEAFELAAELARYDLPITDLNRQLFEEHSFAYLRLLGDCLLKAELVVDLRAVLCGVTIDDLNRHGVSFEETEGLIDVLRQTSEADVVCLAKETPDGIRVSLRSVAELDVGVLARGFGGGGHRFAAGFTYRGSVNQTLEAVRQALQMAIG